MLPLYRALKKGTKDEYVLGYPISKTHMFVPDSYDEERMGVLGNGFTPYYFDTLSIHMEDMIDSEDTKIFASLNEDGKGGDIQELSHYVQWSDEKVTKTAIYKRGLTNCFFHEGYSAKATGIQQ